MTLNLCSKFGFCICFALCWSSRCTLPSTCCPAPMHLAYHSPADSRRDRSRARTAWALCRPCRAPHRPVSGPPTWTWPPGSRAWSPGPTSAQPCNDFLIKFVHSGMVPFGVRSPSCLLGQGHAVGLVDELLVMQDRIVPGHVQVFQYLAHPFLRMQDQLLIVDLGRGCKRYKDKDLYIYLQGIQLESV